jgi:hypothetical protein
MEVKVLTLADGEQIEVQYAFVPDPAIDSIAMAFGKTSQHFKFQEVKGSKNLIMGYAMIADLKIDRYDEKIGRFQVVFPKTSIDKIVTNHNRNGLNKNLNELHRTNQFTEGVFIRGNFQIDSEIGLLPPKGFQVEPDGSWFIIVDTNGNQDIKQKYLDGTYTGFSIESTEFIEVKDPLQEMLQSLVSVQK